MVIERIPKLDIEGAVPASPKELNQLVDYDFIFSFNLPVKQPKHIGIIAGMVNDQCLITFTTREKTTDEPLEIFFLGRPYVDAYLTAEEFQSLISHTGKHQAMNIAKSRPLNMKDTQKYMQYWNKLKGMK